MRACYEQKERRPKPTHLKQTAAPRRCSAWEPLSCSWSAQSERRRQGYRPNPCRAVKLFLESWRCWRWRAWGEAEAFRPKGKGLSQNGAPTETDARLLQGEATVLSSARDGQYSSHSRDCGLPNYVRDGLHFERAGRRGKRGWARELQHWRQPYAGWALCYKVTRRLRPLWIRRANVATRRDKAREREGH